MRRRRRRSGKIPPHIIRKLRSALSFSHRFRYRSTSIALTAAGTTQIQLMNATDNPDYDVGGDFSTACQCETGSRITSIDINIKMKSFDNAKTIEVMVWKDPDGLISSMTPADLFVNDQTSGNMLLRKYALAYRMFLPVSGTANTEFHIRIKRKAMRRIGVMADTDNLRMAVTLEGSSAGQTMAAYGTITTRK